MSGSLARSIRPVSILIIILACFRPAGAEDWKGRIFKEGGATVVQNPSQPIFKGPILSLKEDWTAGGAGTAGAALLAKPWCLAVDGDGRVYVLDIQDACVKGIR